jgi:RNA 3'-terminal phosphate cyclase (ATP)
LSQGIFIGRAGMGRNQGMRCALTLSAMSGEEVQLAGLMSEGPKARPGLGKAAYAAARALARMCQGRLELSGDFCEMTFAPGGKVQPGEYEIPLDQDPRAVLPLGDVIELLALPLCRCPAESQVFIMGATHIPAGFSGGELRHALIPNCRRLGLDCNYLEISPGFLPNAQGEAEFTTIPSATPRPLTASGRFKVQRLAVEVTLSGLPVHLGEQAMEAAQGRLELHGLKAQTSLRKARAAAGMALTLWAEYNGLRVAFSNLGRRGGRPEALAVPVVEALANFLHSGASLPGRMVAPLVPLLCAANGVSRFSVNHLTPELRSALNAADAFFPESVRIDQPGQGEPVQIMVRGQGL